MTRPGVKHERAMADMPGALLLRSGVLRPGDLAAAAALRERDGGSFGESVVRLGYMEEDQLAEFYTRRLMITRVPDHELVDVSKAALGLVTADMAAEFRVVPLEIDPENHLVLVMSDPTDNHAVDEVAFFADRFVVRVVATESAIRDAIERHYGVRFTSPRAADRVARVAQPLAESHQAAAPRSPEPRPPGPPPPSPTLLRAPVATVQARVKSGPRSEAPPSREPNRSPPPGDAKAPAAKASKEAIEEQIVLLTRVKYADATPLPMPVPPPDDYQPDYLPQDYRPEHLRPSDEPILLTHPKSHEPPRPKRDTLPGFAQMTVPDPPLARLRAAHHRDEIAAATLDYVALLMRRALFFVMKKSILIGHDVRGGDLDTASVRKLVINVEAPSLFRDVIASRLPYRGPLPETPANRAFGHALGGVTAEVLFMPIAVRDRVIAVLFADGAAQPLPDAALHATVREAGLAYERLILESKTGR
ncbi:MAG: ral secretory system protein domain protein [Myxococcales bacterium]|nr:ral secretory system protein domain protein [Myxococcales bacterium]